MERKKFIARNNVLTGSSGFNNYTGDVDMPGTLQKVFVEFPGAVVLDGDDDISAPKVCSPQKLSRELGVEPMAFFHTGVSGITSSGVVIRQEDLALIERGFLAMGGDSGELSRWKRIRIYREDAPHGQIMGEIAERDVHGVGPEPRAERSDPALRDRE